MARARHSAEQRAEALRLYREVGPAEASRQTVISKKTISSWAGRTGVQSDAPAKTRAAVEMARLTREQHIEELAADLLEIARSRATRLKAGIESDSEREIATVMGIAIDKSQLLAGEATSRAELVEPKEIREQVEAMRDDLAERRRMREAS